MPIRLIAHQILKERNVVGATANRRNALLPTTKAAENLVVALRGAITEGNPVAGRFTQPAGANPPFQQRLRTYLGGRTDEHFISFTRDATDLLVATLGREPAATGGYLVFAEHDHAGENFLLVVLLSTRARPSFDENINLVSTVSLDTDHLRHAGRIRYEGVEPNDDGVVHYVSKSSEGIYFRDFLGCEAVTDSSVQGNYLHSALRQWAEAKEMPAAQRESMMQRTYTYWHECKREDRPITLTAIANVLQPDDPAPLLAHLGAESTGLAGEFAPPSPSVMRRFVKFAFNHAGLKIEFDRTDWLDRVGVTGDTVTIQQAPPELVEQINAAKHGDD